MRILYIWLALLLLISPLGCKDSSIPMGGGGAPLITAVAPLTAVAAASVTFNATNTGGAVTTWAWTFGGGATPNTSSAASPTVTAGSAGSYSCSVAATNGSGTQTFNFTFVVTAAGGGGSDLGTLGGTITLGDVTISAPQHTLIGNIHFTHTTSAVPAGLPSGFAALGQADVITADHPELMNAPMILAFHYSDTGIADESKICVLHYAPAEGYQAVTLLSLDTAGNVITIDSRSFSTFIVGQLTQTAASVSATSYTTGFVFDENGWQINNFGNNFAPSGNCLGMSGYATWFYSHRAEHLYNKFSDAGDPSICKLLITRAHLAQSQYWAIKQYNYLQTFNDAAIGDYMKAYMQMTQQPLILILGNANGPAHASVVFGWDADGFDFYDVNHANQEQHVNWSDAAGFGTYETYSKFGFVAMPSLGRTEDFEALTQEAEAGFTTSSTISVTTPTPDEHVTGHSTTLEGSITGTVNPAMQLIAYVKGVMQQVPLNNMSFSATIPIANGDNTVVLVAGVNLDTQSDFYLNGATKIFNVIGDSAATELLATLSWDQDGNDVDLYCTDPSGDSAWYAHKETANHMFLDFDNVVGFGPEHITLATANGGIQQNGNYVIRVHYFSDHQTGQGASGVVSVVIFEGLPDQKMVTVPFALGASSEANDQPGSTGPDWVDIATVDLQHRTIHVP